MPPPALRCESLIGPTITYGHFLLLTLLFIFSYESKPLLYPSHSVLFLPLALSFIPPSLPLSDGVPLCQWGGAGGERRNESGSQEAMHLKSPLGHNKTEIDLWFASSAVPLSSEQKQMDGWVNGPTDGRTHSQQKKTVFIRLLDQASAEQSSRCAHAEVRVPAPPSHFCSPLSVSELCPNVLRYNWGLPPSINWQYPTLACCHAAAHAALLYYYSWNVKKSTEKLEIKDPLNFLDCASSKHAHFIHKIQTHSEWYLLTVGSSLSSCTCAFCRTETAIVRCLIWGLSVSTTDTHWTGSH